jgi:alpha-tubulin suppressor-like RCC1 family protein
MVKQMQQTLSIWTRVALCIAALLLVGCGDNGGSSPVASTAPADPLAIQNISFKMGTVCAVRGDGAARCWGFAGHNWDQSKKAVTGPLNQLIIDTNSVNCALNQTDTVYCWGIARHSASLGRGALQDPGDPKTPVAVLTNVAQLDIGNGTVCALTKDGDVYCWGGGYDLRPSTLEPRIDRPTKITNLPKIKQISVGDSHSCAVGVDRSVWCWGSFKYGSDGTGRNAEFRSETPLRVDIPMGGASQVSVGLRAACAVSVRSASVYCWGMNDNGQIGNNDKGNNALYPQKVLLEDGEMAQQVAVGYEYACAMLTSGAARCWGRNVSGYLGNGERKIFGAEAKPVRVQDSSKREFFGFKGIAASAEPFYNASCGWGEGNQAWCWGEGSLGQLGDGNTGESVYVTTPKKVQAIESGWQ